MASGEEQVPRHSGDPFVELHQRVARIEATLEEMERRHTERFQAQTTAMTKAETAMEKRFDNVNEFRQQLNDQAHTFMPRAESISRHDRNAEQLEKVERHFDQDIASINKRLDTMQGILQGQQQQKIEGRHSNAAIYALIGAGVAVLTAVVIIANLLSANGG
jgi:DNA repair exonuclease SbcCD ATPase subunit